MLILRNVVGMPRVLQELRDQGTEIALGILAGLAPFRTAHIAGRHYCPIWTLDPATWAPARVASNSRHAS